LVSMADIIGSYERLPNDAVRAVAVAKRREYILYSRNPQYHAVQKTAGSYGNGDPGKEP